MKKIFILLFFSLIFFLYSQSSLADSGETELPPCVVITHCVKENWEVNDIEDTFHKIEIAISNTPRTNIVEKSPYYIHAEAKTKWRRYTDDLLIKALPSKNIIQVRSESRVGIGDKGVNKRRVDELAYRLMTNQI